QEHRGDWAPGRHWPHLHPPRAKVVDHLPHRRAQRLPRPAPAGPPERADATDVEANHRYVAPPTARPGPEDEPRPARGEFQDLEGELRNFAHGDVIPGRDVVSLELLRTFLVGEEHGVDHVVDVDIRLALRAVSQDLERVGPLQQTPDEVEADAVRL